MSDQGRTNQLLYQALLLLKAPEGDDEHAEARRMALEESALAMLELALESMIREIAHTCRWPETPWREVLQNPPALVAEIEHLRELLKDPESWLSRLLFYIEKMHSAEGAAERRRKSALIASSQQASLGHVLFDCLDAFRALLPRLRETSHEW